jgi:hypothetical protein
MYDYYEGSSSLGGIMAVFIIISIALTVLNIIAAVRVSKMGGSGVGYFFFGWIYIVCSSKVDRWQGFSKGIAIVLGLLTGIGLPIYILTTLKEPNANTVPPVNQNFYVPNGQAMPPQSREQKLEWLKQLRAAGTITEEEYRNMVFRELEK